MASSRLRQAELLASLSLATDLGTGQPLGHGLRTCLLAVRLAREMGCDDDDVRAVYQVSLLRFLGCTADAAETAATAGGDDLALNGGMAAAFNGSRLEMMKALIGSIGADESPVTRSRMVLAALSDREEPARSLSAHCEVATMLARRLGMAERVTEALDAVYERWDGKGYPAGTKGEAIPIEVRIATVARDIDIFEREGFDVRGILDRRSGNAYAPTVVKAYAGLGEAHPEADWGQVLGEEPEPVGYLEDVDAALSVMADFVDLKSPWTRGHSTRVAELAGAAALRAGMDAADCDRLRRAGLVHDLGRIGVENGIWDKSGPLSTDEWEKVRTHPYLTHRILSRCPELEVLGALASSHHERLDASGYHRQATAAQLPVEARLLAAADMLAALMADRPHRGRFDLDTSAGLMRDEVDQGRLDGPSVEWVITAAGGDAAISRQPNPDSLTDREVEVLKLLCTGLTNRQVADHLYISAKTVGRHVENIYTKIGVSTRAGAAVYAMEHRLLH